MRAVNGVGAGPQSNSDNATPTTNTVPGQVTGLTASPGDGFLDLSWNVPGNGGSPIIRYEYSTTNDPWESTGSTSTTFRATRRSGNGASFQNGTLYGVRVRSVNVIGAGPQSDRVFGRPNNQPPVFNSATASRSVSEHAVVGTAVGSAVTATDPENDTISYSITGSNPAGFTVGGANGVIRTGQVLDHEATDSYTITVRASATEGSDTIEVTISVADVEEAPSFANASYSRSVNENVASGSNVGGVITATDPEGDTLTYTLSGTGASTFAVSSSGLITTAADIDYETTSSYSLTLTATDTASLTGATTVNITVHNVIEDATLTGLTVPAANLGLTTARFSATLTNPDAQSATCYFRYRTPRASGSWTAASDSTTGTACAVDVTGLTAGTDYRVQASLDDTLSQRRAAAGGLHHHRQHAAGLPFGHGDQDHLRELGGRRRRGHSGYRHRRQRRHVDLHPRRDRRLILRHRQRHRPANRGQLRHTGLRDPGQLRGHGDRHRHPQRRRQRRCDD